MSSAVVTRLPIGAEVQEDRATHFRVWAPAPRRVALVIETDGYYSAVVNGVGAGARYWYRLDSRLCPDPASRFQPDGPFGPSQVVDPARYRWNHSSWRGISIEGQVLYEL